LILSPVTGEAYVNIYGRDVTQLKLDEEEIKRHRDHLEEMVQERTRELEAARDEAQNANEAKSVFLANMSHELRTPLNAVIGYSEILQETALDENRSSDYEDLGRINKSARYLLSLINDVLDLSKIEASRLELSLSAFDIQKVIDGIYETILPIAHKNGNQLELRIAEDAGKIYADEMRLSQILLNLLTNANKFTRNGCVTFDVHREVLADINWIVFKIKDDGIGMGAEQMSKLFRPFHQANIVVAQKYGGTGLGLAISRKLCRLMGGDITVESEPEQGSEFTVYLPVSVKMPRFKSRRYR
jgi:signal transduction histidine kinase